MHLNGIKMVARHTNDHQCFVVKSGNYFIIFKSDSVERIFVPKDKKGKVIRDYFKKWAIAKTIERLKKWIIL